ncbi:MAG: flavodoxin [Bacteroidetes bacterium HGW-Bacteroidetes-17]|jgi:flavodoxin I|nr:MAG: flavodoxin [Bacteroidetes bacterium HGW-Bacteroidetes-17]
MEKIGIIYWPKNGSVEATAQKIYAHFNESDADLMDITAVTAANLNKYDLIIIGGSTVGAEIWEEAKPNNKWNVFFKSLDEINLEGKKVALFGLGDQVLYPENFVDGLSVIYDEMKKRRAKLLGAWSLEGYSFTDSKAIENNQFVGLAIDEDKESELTDGRINKWLAQLEKEMI